MAHRTLPGWLWPLAALLVAAVGSALIVHTAFAARRAAFDTDARIAHRLLSQVAAQHDAMLATLVLMQPAAADSRRLPALAPQVLRLDQRAGTEAWPAPQAEALRAAEARSATLQRAVPVAAELAAGRYTLVRAGAPVAYALTIDIAAMVPWPDWPLPREGSARAELRLGGAAWALQAGGAEGATPWRLSASKALAAESQPFELVIEQAITWRELPWGRVLLWWLFSAALGAAATAWWRQREHTRRAQALLRLGQAARLNTLGELAAGMAHELNQPLTAVLAGTQAAARLIDEAEPDLATAREALARSAQQARRAADVVARLRRLVQPPDPDAAPQRIALASAVDAVLDLLKPQLRQLGVAVAAGGLGAAAVRADPVALEQVLHNLVHNALQALEQVPAERRRLVFSAESESGRCTLRLHDSGPGFTPQALQEALDPFFTTRSGGLGLGMSLCDTLAAGMGGTLRVANHAEGGALVTLTLPAA